MIERFNCILIFILSSPRQRDEMRKKKNSENNNNSFVPSQQQNHHHSESNGNVNHAHAQSFDRHSSNSDTQSLSSVKDRHRSSQDSTDQYIVVEALHDDSVSFL